MILANSFKNSSIARDMEFTTTHSTRDAPLVLQFAAQNANDLAQAAELAAPFCNGIDINCGCPQSWACKEGLGAHLMSKPELVADMIGSVKRITAGVKFESTNGTGLPCSVKIRVHKDLKETVEFAKRAGMFRLIKISDSKKRQVLIGSLCMEEQGLRKVQSLLIMMPSNL